MLRLDFTIILVIIGLGTDFASDYMLIPAFGQTGNEQESADTFPFVGTLISGVIGGVSVKGLEYFLTRRGKKEEEKGKLINRKVSAYSIIAFELTRMIESADFQTGGENLGKIDGSVHEVDNSIKENLILLKRYILPEWMEARSNREILYKYAHIRFVDVILAFRNRFVKTYNDEICKEYENFYGRHRRKDAEDDDPRIKTETITLDDLKFLPQCEKVQNELIKIIRNAITRNKIIQIDYKSGYNPHKATDVQPYILGVRQHALMVCIRNIHTHTNGFEFIRLDAIENPKVTDDGFSPIQYSENIVGWDAILEKMEIPSQK